MKETAAQARRRADKEHEENRRLRKLIKHMGECIGGRWVATEIHVEGDKIMLHICVSDDTEDEKIAQRISGFLASLQDMARKGDAP